MRQRPTPNALLRLLAIAMLLLGMLGLPAAAQDDVDGAATEEEVEAPGDEEESADGRGPRPSRGQGRLADGEIRGHLAPAVSDAGEQVTVHAVAQIHDHRGNGGRPEGVGGGRPDRVEGEEPATPDVTFTVDYGDGSQGEAMRPTKTSGANGRRRALAHHVYEAEGEYAVTITATPLVGAPITIELVAQVGSGAARLDGDSRIESAVAISQDAFPVDGSADAVLLARTDAFADALTASTLAFVSNAPVLLTGTGELATIVTDEIARVLADGAPVFLLGGEAAISSEVEQGLVDDGYRVIRLSDDDRIGTALAIAEFVIDGGMAPSQVVVAAAGDFPDALAGSAYAAANGGIILLTDTESLDDRVATLLGGLADTTQVVVAGGEAAISAATYASLEALGMPVMRVAGDSRYHTAALLAELGYAGGDTVVLATGTNYPDALAGAVHAARLGAPVLLVDGTLPQPVIDFLTANAGTLDTVVALGGDSVITDDLIAQAMGIISTEG